MKKDKLPIWVSKLIGNNKLIWSYDVQRLCKKEKGYYYFDFSHNEAFVHYYKTREDLLDYHCHRDYEFYDEIGNRYKRRIRIEKMK